MMSELLAWLILSFNWLMNGSSFNMDLVQQYIWRLDNGYQLYIFGEVVKVLRSLSVQEFCWILHFYIRNLQHIENFVELRSSSMIMKGIPANFPPLNVNLANGLLFKLPPILKLVSPDNIRQASQRLIRSLHSLIKINQVIENNMYMNIGRIPAAFFNYNFHTAHLCARLDIPFATWRHQQFVRETSPSLLPLLKTLIHFDLHLQVILLLLQIHSLNQGTILQNLQDTQQIINEIISIFHQVLANWEILQQAHHQRTPEHQELMQNFQSKLNLLTTFLKALCENCEMQNTDMHVLIRSLELIDGPKVGYTQYTNLLAQVYAAFIKHLWVKVIEKRKARIPLIEIAE